MPPPVFFFLNRFLSGLLYFANITVWIEKVAWAYVRLNIEGWQLALKSRGDPSSKLWNWCAIYFKLVCTLHTLGVFFINLSHGRKITAPEKKILQKKYNFLTHRQIMRFCSWPEMAWDFFSRWKLLQFDCCSTYARSRRSRLKIKWITAYKLISSIKVSLFQNDKLKLDGFSWWITC